MTSQSATKALTQRVARKAQFGLRTVLVLPLLAGLFLIWADQAYDHFILIMLVYGAVFGVFRITTTRNQARRRPLAMVAQATAAGFLGGTFTGLFVLPVALSLSMPGYFSRGLGSSTLLRDYPSAALGGALCGAILAAAGAALGGALWALLVNTVFARGESERVDDSAGRASQQAGNAESRFGRWLAWGLCAAVLIYPTGWLGHTAWRSHVENSVRARLEAKGVTFHFGETVGISWLRQILDRDYSCPLLRRCSSISVTGALSDDEWQLIEAFYHLASVDVMLSDVDDDDVAIAVTSLAAHNGANVSLIIESPNITDAALAHTVAIPNLTVLHVSGSGITDDGLVHLQNLRFLWYLGVHGSRVTDAGVIHLTTIPGLFGIDISETSISDEGVRLLCTMPSLVEVSLKGCNVTDAGVKHLAGAIALQSLYLDNTKVTDAGLRQLKNVPNLHFLSLAGCNVTDDGVGQLQGSQIHVQRE